jgi:hypothetical protein
MSRLTHTDAGFLRSLQISKARLFIFTEGGLDRPFMERVVNFVFPARIWEHRVIAIKEFPSAAGGKPALLALFKVLRQKRKLSFTAFGKPMVCVVLADKDIDDVSRTRLRSPHLLYTQTYDIEGILFHCGDLLTALADTCLITRSQAMTLVGTTTTWLTNYVNAWKDWTCLAMLSHLHGVNVGCGYKSTSTINPKLIHPTDPVKLAQLISALQAKLGMTADQFNAHYARIEKRFQSSLASEPLRYFKGKWLQALLQKHLEARARIPDSNIPGAGDRVMSALVAQVGMQPDCQCCSPYAAALQPLCSHL